jgi:hypothetical protein
MPTIVTLPAEDHPKSMNSLPEAKVSVRRMGQEHEPLVIIDQFSGIVDQLLQSGRAAQYRHAGASYPGIRSWADPSYLDRRRPLMMQVMQQIFGFSKVCGLMPRPPRSLRLPKTGYRRSSASLIMTMRAGK